MPITASQLRADVYRLLDQVIETGVPLEVERGGYLVRITVQPKVHWLDRMITRDTMVGDPESFTHIDWSDCWDPGSLEP